MRHAIIPPARLSLSPADVHVRLPFAARDIPPSTQTYQNVTMRWNPDAATVRPAPADDDYGPCEGTVGHACDDDADGPDGLCERHRDRAAEQGDAS